MYSTDSLKIDTPEQIELELPLAGLGSRFLALTIDTILQSVLYIVVVLVFALGASQGLIRLNFLPWIPASFAPAITILFVFCIYWGYFAFFEILWKGQTPGKRLAKIRAIHSSGRPLNAYEAIGRNLLRAIDGLPGFYGVGIVCMMLNKQNRRLGDFVAGTVVIHEKNANKFDTGFVVHAGAALESGTALSQVSSDELVLIETFLQRRFDLDPVVRDATAHQIAQRITAKTGTQPGQNESLDHFLEGIARQVRDTSRLR